MLPQHQALFVFIFWNSQTCLLYILDTLRTGERQILSCSETSLDQAPKLIQRNMQQGISPQYRMVKFRHLLTKLVKRANAGNVCAFIEYKIQS